MYFKHYVHSAQSSVDGGEKALEEEAHGGRLDGLEEGENDERA